MLRKISPTKVESDSGWSLSSGPFHCWMYSEGERSIYVFKEPAFFDRQWGSVIYLSRLPESWDPPHNIYAISANQRAQITANIEEGLRFLEIHFRLE